MSQTTPTFTLYSHTLSTACFEALIVQYVQDSIPAAERTGVATTGLLVSHTRKNTAVSEHIFDWLQ